MNLQSHTFTSYHLQTCELSLGVLIEHMQLLYNSENLEYSMHRDSHMSGHAHLSVCKDLSGVINELHSTTKTKVL